MRVSFIRSTFDEAEPEQVEVSGLEGLGQALVNHASVAKGGAAWIAGGTAGRTDEHVQTVDFWTLDYDGVEPEWSKLRAWNYIAHTTHSHSDARPSWRVIVEIDAPCAAAEWKLRYKGKVLQHGLKASTDGKTCNPARIWYTPSPDALWRANATGEPAAMPSVERASIEPELLEGDNADGLLNDGSAMWGAVERCMRTLPPSISGQGGDDRLFEAACVLRSSFRLTPDAAFKALQIFNERCRPPWDEDRLVYKIQQAASDKQHPPGELIPADVKATLLREAGEPEPEGLFIDVSFDTPEKLHVDWTCEELGIVPGRASMLYADPHAGKTTIQAELALAFATGTRAFGNLDVGAARQVVCLECEDDFDLRHHIGLFRRDRPLNPGMLLITRVPVFCTAMPEIERIFSDKPGIIFINSLRAFTPGLEENSSDFAEPLLALAALSRRFQVPVWINHHTNKAGGVRGTSAIEAAAGNSWTLTREGPRRIMSHTASRMCSERQPFELVLTPNQLVRRPVEKQRVEPEVEALAGKVYAKLKSADRWLTLKELGRDFAESSKMVKQAVAMLAQAGAIASEEGRGYHWDPKRASLS